MSEPGIKLVKAECAFQPRQRFTDRTGDLQCPLLAMRELARQTACVVGQADTLEQRGRLVGQTGPTGGATGRSAMGRTVESPVLFIVR